MIPIGKLKSNLQFNKNLGDLVEVMKLAATLQFNQFRLREEPSEDYAHLLDDVFGALLSAGAKSDLLTEKDNLPAPLEVAPRAAGLLTGPALFLLASSDEGFLGELNFLLVNRLLSSRRPQDKIICVGAQGVNYLREIQVGFSSLESPGEKIDSQRIAAVRDHILSEYLKRNVGKVYVVYSRFINITVQQVELEALLPLPEDRSSPAKSVKHLLIEPDIDSVIEGWIKSWLDFRLYQIFWSSKLAEFAARVMHLEGSVQELNKINSHLRMEYFKYLHGLSDKSIRELTAARLIGKER